MRPISHSPLGHDWIREFALKRTFDRVDLALQFLGSSIPWFNILDFDPTVGTGTKFDTASMQRAIDRVGEAGGGVLYIPEGTYLQDGPLTIAYNNVSVIGSGWDTSLDFSSTGVDGSGFVVADDAVGTLENIVISSMHLIGGAGGVINFGAAVRISLLTFVSSSTFDHLLIDSWSYGFINGGLSVGMDTSLFSKNIFRATAFSAALLMTDCRFTDNLDGGSNGIQEFAGSANNVFNGNQFSTQPNLSGTGTTCRIHANVGLTTAIDATGGSVPSGITAPAVYRELLRWTRTAGSGNINLDTIGIIGTPGRRITLAVATATTGGGAPPRTVTIRDSLTSGAGTGGLQLNGNVDQVVLNGQEWWVFFILNHDSTKWIELSRVQVA